MDKFGMRVVNPGRLYDDFDHLSRSQGQRTLRKSALAGARVVLRTVREQTPVRTGLLKRQIRIFRARTDRYSAESYVVGIGRSGRKYVNSSRNRRKHRVGVETQQLGAAYYGKFVELGTSRMKATPFLRPGFDQSEADAEKAMLDALGAEIDKALFG